VPSGRQWQGASAHTAMTGEEIRRMFPEVPIEKFHVHDWRNDVVTLGRIANPALGLWAEKKRFI